jgi:putative flippase GtrA
MTYLFRYILNGLVATAVHYSVLTVNVELIRIPSAGLSNLIASIAGITTSFLGSRYYVFRQTGESLWRQGVRFSILYGLIALLHGSVLFLLSDLLKVDYRVGFLIATILQVILSYYGNRILVFRV